MSNETIYPLHELALVFPNMDGDAFTDLVADIKANGLQQPIALWKGQIIDGRHRLGACRKAGVEPEYVDVGDEVDPKQYVLSLNLERRHLTASQRAAIVVAVRNWTPSGNTPQQAAQGGNVAALPATNADMAQEAQVSVRTIRATKRGVEAGFGADMREGNVSANEAARKPPELPPAPPTPTAQETTARRVPKRKTNTKEQLQAENVEQAEKIVHLESEVRMLRGEASDLPHERDAEFQRLRNENRTLQASLTTSMGKRSDLQDEHKADLKAHGCTGTGCAACKASNAGTEAPAGYHDEAGNTPRANPSKAQGEVLALAAPNPPNGGPGSVPSA